MPSDDVPLMASYCVYVRDTQAPFHVDDSPADGRVDGHPKRKLIRAYCGIPLTDERGRMFGSVCHFDFEPLQAKDADVELLEAFAPLVAHVATPGFKA